MNNYNKENDILFTNLIKNTIEASWLRPIEEQKSNNFILELYVTPNCNKQCTYCYLQKNKDLIYPKDIRDKNQILNNLRILLDYYLLQNYKFYRIDLFSGEIWGYEFGNEVFNILLEYLNKGLIIDTLLIPSNCSFCEFPEIIKVIEDYIEKFSLYNCRLTFSASYDGEVIDSLQRPYFKGANKENFINNLFKFCIKYNYGFHPMIDASYIEKQPENYDSWIKLFKKYYQEDFNFTFGAAMQLEVRSAEWTDEKIISYLKYLKHYIDVDLKEYFKNDLKHFHKFVIKGEKEGSVNGNWDCYMPYFPVIMEDALGCSLGVSLPIRLGDLAIVSCHRTSYEQFLLGKYKIENNKIIGLECLNFPLASSIFVTSFLNKPFCCNCSIRNYCIKSCLGANYETNGELFHPIEENCNLQKAKIIFLYYYYKEIFGFQELYWLDTIYNRLLNEEPEVVQKWQKMIQTML